MENDDSYFIDWEDSVDEEHNARSFSHQVNKYFSDLASHLRLANIMLMGIVIIAFLNTLLNWIHNRYSNEKFGMRFVWVQDYVVPFVDLNFGSIIVVLLTYFNGSHIFRIEKKCGTLHFLLIYILYSCYGLAGFGVLEIFLFYFFSYSGFYPCIFGIYIMTEMTFCMKNSHKRRIFLLLNVEKKYIPFIALFLNYVLTWKIYWPFIGAFFMGILFYCCIDCFEFITPSKKCTASMERPFLIFLRCVPLYQINPINQNLISPKSSHSSKDSHHKDDDLIVLQPMQPGFGNYQIQQSELINRQIQQPYNINPQIQQPYPANPQFQQPYPANLQIQQPYPANPQIQQPYPANPQFQQPYPTNQQMTESKIPRYDYPYADE